MISPVAAEEGAPLIDRRRFLSVLRNGASSKFWLLFIRVERERERERESNVVCISFVGNSIGLGLGLD